MDHSWRPSPLPPIPGNNTNNNICPICSISHFPFCPPPPFIQNPRFHYSQPQHNYNHAQPHFDHHHPFPNQPSSSNYNTYDYNPIDARRPMSYGYGTNPSLDMSPYASYDNGGIKRMKIEPIDNDNERILKLIHDHGNAHAETCQLKDEMGLKRRREVYHQIGQPQFDQIDTMQHHLQPNHNFLPADVNRSMDVKAYNFQQPFNWSESKAHYGPNSFGGQPPLPASPSPPPPPPLPIDPPPKRPSLFPVAVSSSLDSSSSHSTIPQNQSSAHNFYTVNAGYPASTLSSAEEFHTRQSSSEKHIKDVQLFPLLHLPSEKPNIVDASHIFKHPHRASRPDHLVIILRGLPGSGKSYLSKMLRDIEVENGGEAPRIHSMDEYFMTEVEKADDSELSKSSGSLRGKRQVMKTVMEYCYEPEMEEAYRASMLKAFKKTLDEGVYSFIIVDDRNLRVADFAQFWATAKRSGYEVYLVEASYKDPAGCAARNVHNFTLDDIQKMARQWEEAPSLYLKMDIKSLLHGDGFDESGIQEVDMDMEEEDAIDASQRAEVKSPQDNIKDQVDDFTHNDVGPLKDVKHPVTKNQKEEVKHLSKSKWSNNDLDGSESIEGDGGKKKDTTLSGLILAYSKEGKSLRWGDQGGNVGFSISATRKTNTRSLVIGPGPGYNLKSNPLSEEDYVKPAQNAVQLKNQNVFQEQIRAERESFKAVFDKRRQRIGGFNMDEE